ncbi:hypothetical protein GGX14DRAFT_621453 [Mycena pura]|uniref:Uncharacterized protein n=1 Tax=Mycena pura TaxID=153505 RepID=A0AAD6VG81_9AGAR|nr:hypothetical protein GGX14DRAFT_621453 [Mycena pura]
MHVTQISRYYTGMDDLIVFTCMATYGSIACSLVTDAFMWSESKRAESSSALGDANNEGWHTVGKGGKTVQTGSIASGICGGNGNDEGGDRGRRGGRKGGRGGGRGGRGGGRGRGDQDTSSEGRPRGKRFREATHYTLQVPDFTTPPKDDSFRVPTIEDITSRNFANLTIPGGLSRYDPDEDDEGMGDETQRTLIHGTRSSSLPKFMFNGILPPALPNTLCRGPAFYTTTHAECAYLHTLLHHPRILSPDPVALLIFNISPPVIHGNRRIDNHPLFSFLWFKTQDHDSLIEPNREGTTVYIPQFPYLPAGTQPTQVAAGTEAGWVYLSSCLGAKNILCKIEPSVVPVAGVSAVELALATELSLPEPSSYPPELTTALSSYPPSVTDVNAYSPQGERCFGHGINVGIGENSLPMRPSQPSETLARNTIYCLIVVSTSEVHQKGVMSRDSKGKSPPVHEYWEGVRGTPISTAEWTRSIAGACSVDIVDADRSRGLPPLSENERVENLGAILGRRGLDEIVPPLALRRKVD